jgi:hypothetical protein
LSVKWLGVEVVDMVEVRSGDGEAEFMVWNWTSGEDVMGE